MGYILIIEDEKGIQEDLCMLLEFEGYTVRAADNGQQGLQQIQAECPDLIFCDALMPVMDGYQLLAALRADPTYAGIPFVFLSAKILPEDIKQGMQAGASAYLKKPFTSEHLLDIINQLLK